MDSLLDALPAGLRQQVEDIVAKYPDVGPVLYGVYAYAQEGSERARKAPKLAQTLEPDLPLADKDSVIIRDVSVTLPERKKFDLLLSSSGVALQRADSSALSLPKARLGPCLVLAIPEKAKPQFSVVLLDTQTTPPEVFAQFTLAQGPLAADKTEIRTSLGSINAAARAGSSPDTVEFVATVMQELVGVPVVRSTGCPTAVAHRGAKEGLLCFVDELIFFGFKRPLLVVPVGLVESVSYTAVLRMTFNLTLRLLAPVAGALEYEFSLIDQENFDAIDAYVKANGLNDLSMSESRRAKLNSKAEPSTNELERAAQEAGVDVSAYEAAGDNEEEEEANDETYQMSEDNDGSSEDGDSEDEGDEGDEGVEDEDDEDNEDDE